ncbi:MAG: hypothetical protein AVDCRST_MAG42-1832 [uncultured Chthoniobacterales bacterium]|uniref:Uncharacterized protein n=1 Tax=uncultured Chthoniobacterales bacterium TaxID=1836801 RepID=A0A6J4HZM7_9BACT|nr:MAG: hypothetical protein AVDCRST_MAG42-1832 [uncultured Chthoniobacterales bacterium]
MHLFVRAVILSRADGEGPHAGMIGPAVRLMGTAPATWPTSDDRHKRALRA